MEFLKSFVRSFLFPVSILSGTIIGAGMFALPHVFEEIGWLTGLIYFVLFAAVFSLLHLMYADIILRSGGKPQFAYLAKKYLGTWSFGIAMVVSTVGFFLILTVFITLSAGFVELIFPISARVAVFIFWALASFAIFFEIKRVAFLELVITLAMILIIATLFFLGAGHTGDFLWAKIWESFNWGTFILPFGPILFSLSGRTAIPSVIAYFRRVELPIGLIKRAIIYGTLTPVFIYILFVLGVVGLSRGHVSSDAVSGLLGSSYPILFGVGFLGIIAIFSTYILVGRSIRDALVYDLNFSKWSTVLLVVALPMLLYTAGLNNFFSLISVVGGVFVSCDALLVILIWQALNHSGEERKLITRLGSKTAIALFLVIFLGFIYEIFSLLSLVR